MGDPHHACTVLHSRTALVLDLTGETSAGTALKAFQGGALATLPRTAKSMQATSTTLVSTGNNQPPRPDNQQPYQNLARLV